MKEESLLVACAAYLSVQIRSYVEDKELMQKISNKMGGVRAFQSSESVQRSFVMKYPYLDFLWNSSLSQFYCWHFKSKSACPLTGFPFKLLFFPIIMFNLHYYYITYLYISSNTVPVESSISDHS